MNGHGATSEWQYVFVAVGWTGEHNVPGEMYEGDRNMKQEVISCVQE